MSAYHAPLGFSITFGEIANHPILCGACKTVVRVLKGTITLSGGKKSLIQKLLKNSINKLLKFRIIDYIIKPEYMFSKEKEEEEEEEEEEEGEEEEEEKEEERGGLPPRRPPRSDHDPLPDYPGDLLID